MNHVKKAGVAFILTILLVLCAFGFWLVDYQSGKIAFDSRDTRIDVIVEDTSFAIEWRQKSFQLTPSVAVSDIIETGMKFLPPDVQGFVYWLISLNK